MAEKRPGPLTCLIQRCDEMETYIKNAGALQGDCLNPMFLELDAFVKDVRKYADEILALVNKGLQECSRKTE